MKTDPKIFGYYIVVDRELVGIVARKDSEGRIAVSEETKRLLDAKDERAVRVVLEQIF